VRPSAANGFVLGAVVSIPRKVGVYARSATGLDLNLTLMCGHTPGGPMNFTRMLVVRTSGGLLMGRLRIVTQFVKHSQAVASFLVVIPSGIRGFGSGEG
jgi:hypothetical protein